MKQLPPVDDDVYAALQARAEPLVDDINSLLRRLLAQAGGPAETVAPAPPKRRKVPTGRRAGSSDTEYELPVLRALVEAGGRAPTSEVIDKVGAALSDRLTAVDWDELPSSGYVRWKNRTQFARLNLVKRGDLEINTPRGVWAITEQGRAREARSR